jgi:hypothetical protein
MSDGPFQTKALLPLKFTSNEAVIVTANTIGYIFYPREYKFYAETCAICLQSTGDQHGINTAVGEVYGCVQWELFAEGSLVGKWKGVISVDYGNLRFQNRAYTNRLDPGYFYSAGPSEKMRAIILNPYW